jgi:hypothetical protein
MAVEVPPPPDGVDVVVSPEGEAVGVAPPAAEVPVGVAARVLEGAPVPVRVGVPV